MARGRAVGRTGRLVAACALAVLLAVGATAVAPVLAAEPVGDVLSRIDAAREVAERGVRDPDPGRMGEVRERLGDATEVEIGGAPVVLSPRAGLAELDGDTARDFEVASDHLRRLGTELAAAAEVPPADRTDIDRTLQAAYAGIRDELTALEHLNRFVGEQLLRLLTATAQVEGLLRLLLIVGLAALTVGLAIWIVRRAGIVTDRATDAATTRGDDRPDWRAVSDEALARGDLDAALRASYRALLATLDARDLLRDRPSLTAAKARRRLTANGELRPKVEAATITFERVVYAGEDASRDSVEAVRQAEQAASRR